MTVIAVLKHPTDGIWLASDGRAGGANDAIPCATPKLGNFEGFSFGYCGSYRFGQMLLYAFRPPKHPKNIDTDDYMFCTWLEALREYMAEYGIVRTTDGVEHTDGADCIIVYRDQIYILQEDFSLLRSEEPYAAVGAGAAYAVGAMNALSLDSLGKVEMGGAFIVDTAVRVAINHCPGCGLPIHLMKHDPDSAPRRKPRVKKSTSQVELKLEVDRGTPGDASSPVQNPQRKRRRFV